MLVYGAVLVLIMVLRPEGIMGTNELTPAYVRRVLKRWKKSPVTRPDESTVLELKGVNKLFGGVQAVSDMSFVIRRGELAGLI